MENKKTLTRFIVRTLLAALPVLVFVILYVVSDPFGVVHTYRPPYTPGDTLAINFNAGYVSIESYRKHNPERHFNAFILGSSMSQNYKAEWWEEHLPDDASVCHLDASMETVEGIRNKLLLLERDGTPVRYALVVIEEEMLHRIPDENSHLFAQHPATTSPWQWAPFHLTFFKAFKQPALVEHAIAPHHSAQALLEAKLVSGDLPHRIEDINESYYAEFDSLITTNPDAFFTPERLAKRRFRELPRPLRPAIGAELRAQLTEIKALFDRQSTEYLILIPPRYQRVTLNPYDRCSLQEIFGSRNVFDFSDYAPMANDPRCYYDNPAHLISAKCKQLLDSAYARPIAPPRP
ncbi:MAG: hypothetical protein J6X70_00560 [Muribaculaceae bacterium]|nr:hypothetical protein [Muribaculaceae bacterium]